MGSLTKHCLSRFAAFCSLGSGDPVCDPVKFDKKNEVLASQTGFVHLLSLYVRSVSYLRADRGEAHACVAASPPSGLASSIAHPSR
eukprot:1471072-Amphidinium_carterae.1